MHLLHVTIFIERDVDFVNQNISLEILFTVHPQALLYEGCFLNLRSQHAKRARLFNAEDQAIEDNRSGKCMSSDTVVALMNGSTDILGTQLPSTTADMGGFGV